MKSKLTCVPSEVGFQVTGLVVDFTTARYMTTVHCPLLHRHNGRVRLQSIRFSAVGTITLGSAWVAAARFRSWCPFGVGSRLCRVCRGCCCRWCSCCFGGLFWLGIWRWKTWRRAAWWVQLLQLRFRGLWWRQKVGKLVIVLIVVTYMVVFNLAMVGAVAFNAPLWWLVMWR